MSDAKGFMVNGIPLPCKDEEARADITEINTSLSHKEDTITIDSISIPQSQMASIANTSVFSIIRWGKIATITGTLRVTEQTTSLNVLTTEFDSKYRPKYIDVWITGQWFSDSSGCDIKITKEGNINVAIPGGSVNKDIKVSGSWVCNG